MEDLKRKYLELIDKYGEWTAHKIKLADGFYTMNEFNENTILYLRRIVQIANDFFNGALENKRILDLGCLEGGFAVEFALHGAEVVAMEGRESNLIKLIFTKNVLSLDNIQTVLDDVRNISIKKYDIFDCVLCLGILYHLDQESLGSFLKNIYEMTSGIVIMDTHISLYDKEELIINNRKYYGASYEEHTPAESPEQIRNKKGSSLNNRESFFLTQSSLLNLLQDIGFTSVYNCDIPYYDIMFDRRTLVAIKGSKIDLRSYDRELTIHDRHPEHKDYKVVSLVNRLPVKGIF